jgi:hypothetical protein
VTNFCANCLFAPLRAGRSNREGREEQGGGAGGPRPGRQALRLHAAALAKERELDPVGEKGVRV